MQTIQRFTCRQIYHKLILKFIDGKARSWLTGSALSDCPEQRDFVVGYYTKETKFLEEIETKVLGVFLLAILFTVTSTAFYLFKLMQPLTYFFNVHWKEENLIENYIPHSLWFKKFIQNSQDYVEKPQRNCTVLNLASGQAVFVRFSVDPLKVYCTV